MIGFVKLVGAIIVAVIFALIVVAIAGYFWLKWKMKKLTGSLGDKLGEAFAEFGAAMGVANVPPLRVKLLRIENHELSNAEQMQAWTENITQQGFEMIGDFEVQPAMMELRSFVNQETNSCAVFYEHPMVGQWLDIYSVIEDGSESFTLTTDQKNLMDARDGHTIMRVTSLTTPAKAYEKFLKERPERDWTFIPPGEFVNRFQQSYADEMDWRVGRGGPTADEIKRISEKEGSEFNPQLVNNIQQAWKNQAGYQYEEEMLENYLAQSDLSAREWEKIRNRIIFIHQLTTADRVMDMIEYVAINDDASDYDDAYEALQSKIKESLKQYSPEQAFDRILNDYQITGRFEKAGVVEKPIRAIAYIGPEFEDE